MVAVHGQPCQHFLQHVLLISADFCWLLFACGFRFCAGWQHAMAAVHGSPTMRSLSDAADCCCFMLACGLCFEQVGTTQWQLSMGSHTMRSLSDAAEPTFIFSGVLEGDNDTFYCVIFKRSECVPLHVIACYFVRQAGACNEYYY
jgi:hypothetical protein